MCSQDLLVYTTYSWIPIASRKNTLNILAKSLVVFMLGFLCLLEAGCARFRGVRLRNTRQNIFAKNLVAFMLGFLCLLEGWSVRFIGVHLKTHGT